MRNTFALASVVSLALCAGALFMWGRSQFVCDLVWYGTDTHETGVMFSRRAVYLYHERVIGAHRLKGSPAFGHGTQAAFNVYRPPNMVSDLGTGEFRFIQGDNGRTRQWFFTLPHWFVVVATSALPAAWVIGRIRRRK